MTERIFDSAAGIAAVLVGAACIVSVFTTWVLHPIVLTLLPVQAIVLAAGVGLLIFGIALMVRVFTWKGYES